jgi:hypothetical protein
MTNHFLAKFKWRAENITTGETQQRNLNDRAEGLMHSIRVTCLAMMCAKRLRRKDQVNCQRRALLRH